MNTLQVRKCESGQVGNRVVRVPLTFPLSHFPTFAHDAFGVFFNPLMEEFGWSRAAIAGASSTAFFSMGIFGVIIGRLNDRQ